MEPPGRPRQPPFKAPCTPIHVSLVPAMGPSLERGQRPVRAWKRSAQRRMSAMQRAAPRHGAAVIGPVDVVRKEAWILGGWRERNAHNRL